MTVPTAALDWACQLDRANRKAIVELVHMQRQGRVREVEEVVVGHYEPHDRTRQLLRQVVRYLADTPEIQWPGRLMSESA